MTATAADPETGCFRCSPTGFGPACPPCSDEIAQEAFEQRTAADLADGSWVCNTAPPNVRALPLGRLPWEGTP